MSIQPLYDYLMTLTKQYNVRKHFCYLFNDADTQQNQLETVRDYLMSLNTTESL